MVTVEELGGGCIYFPYIFLIFSRIVVCRYFEPPQHGKIQILIPASWLHS